MLHQLVDYFCGIYLCHIASEIESRWPSSTDRVVGVQPAICPVIAIFARNLGVGSSNIEDLVQDVLMGFYAVQPKFSYNPAKGRLRGYLKTCVVHQLSRRTAEKKLKIEGTPVEEFDLADEKVEKAWAASWEREHLNRAIEQVRQQLENNSTFNAFYRLVVDHTDAEAVASEFNLSLNSVYLAKSRCLARVRLVLEQIEDDEG